jgi:VWFA-related protein
VSTRRRIFVLTTVLICLRAGITAQEPQTTFRATTRLIVHAVTVRDATGQPIAGLGPADFDVVEDGRPQTVAFVEFQRLEDSIDRVPLPAATDPADSLQPARPTRQGIRIPSAGDGRYRSRRLLILYFDLSSMSTPDAERAYSGAIGYVERRLTPADAVAIITFDAGIVRVREDFTDDRERLSARLRLLAAGGDVNGDGVADEVEAGSTFGENDAEFNMFSSDRQLAALQRTADDLRGIPEQKTLVYFGSGLRLNGTNNQAQVRATVNAAARANVTINPIDARGLVAFAPLGDATRAGTGGIGLFSGAQAQSTITRFQRSQDTLYTLARDTGGEALFDQNDLMTGVVRAADAVSSYYLIGYYSTQTQDDGRFRRVKVTLRGRGDVRLAYREGYTADKVFAAFTEADKERQLEEALRLDQPLTDVRMAVEINVFRLNRSEYYVPVSVKIPGREIALARSRGAARTRLDVIGEVKDDYGVTHRNLRDALDIRIDQETESAWASRPLQYQTGFTLLPGAYVLKMLVRDATTGRIGTYEMPFSVANAELERAAAPMSTVVLSNQQVGADGALHSVQMRMSADKVNPLVVDGRQWLPSVTRVFAVGRDLHVLAHAYRTSMVAPEPLVSYVGLYRAGVKVRESAPIVIPDASVSMTRDVIPLAFVMPLADLEPGEYDCQFTLLLAGGEGRASFWRTRIMLVR